MSKKKSSSSSSSSSSSLSLSSSSLSPIELPQYYKDLYNYFIIIDKFYNFTVTKKLGKFSINRLETLLSSTSIAYSEKKLLQLKTICPDIIQLAYVTDNSTSDNDTTVIEISFPKSSAASIKGSEKRKKLVNDCIEDYIRNAINNGIGIDNILEPSLHPMPIKPETIDDIYTNDPYKYNTSSAFPSGITGICSPIKTNDNNNDDKITTKLSNNPDDIIEYIKTLPFYSSQIEAYKAFHGKPPQYQQLNEKLNSNMLDHIIHNVLKIKNLYKHQALGIDAIRRGDHLVVSTSTASGKSLIYNLSIVDAVIAVPSITALYLFPTKALAQDQLRALNVLCDSISKCSDTTISVKAIVCDGDTSTNDRKLIKSQGANVVLTNPDFIHYTMLPEHKDWVKIFRNLRYVVVDEAHYYKGVFGINVSFILRRLIRICSMYGSYPQFICASATIANPKEHICKLLPIDCIGGLSKLTVLDANSDGSPSYEKRLLIWNPKLKTSKVDIPSTSLQEEMKTISPLKKKAIIKQNRNESETGTDSLQDFLKGCENNVRTIEGITSRAEKYKNQVPKRKRENDEIKSTEASEVKGNKKVIPYVSCGNNEQEERTSTIVETALIFSTLIKRKIRTLAFCKVRKLVELVLLYTLQDLRISAPHLCDTVDSYRGGYTKDERRRIEQDLFSGKLLGITATSALEVGVDIGSLDVVITMGFPGSFSSYFQQIGRAGRKGKSLSILVCFNTPVDQFFAKNPSFLFDSESETASIDTNNIFVIRNHILAAAKEIPLLCDNEYTIPDRNIFGEIYDEVLEYLVKIKSLYAVGDKGNRILVPHPSCNNPARNISIRHIDPVTISVVDDTINQVIDSLGYSRAFYELFEGAIYIHRAHQYLVTKLDIVSARAHCKPCNVNYFTGAMNATNVNIIKVIESSGYISNGTVNIIVKTYGYRKISFNGDLLETGECSLPPLNFETRAMWIDLPLSVKKHLEKFGLNVFEAIHSINHLFKSISPLFCDCDVNDVGTEHVQGQDGVHRIMIFDKIAGGCGICDTLFNHGKELIQRALQITKSCLCSKDCGCPSCIFDHRCSNYNNQLSKKGAIKLLESLLEHANENINENINNEAINTWSPSKLQKKDIDQKRNKYMDYKTSNSMQINPDDYKHLSNFNQDYDLCN